MKRLARRVAAACLLVAIGVLAGVLAAHIHVRVKVTHRPLPPAQVTPAVRCPGVKATMSCVLQHQAPPASTAKTLGAPVPGAPLAVGSTSASESGVFRAVYGVDFGWSTMSATGLRAIHAKFAASYLSPDISKNWTRAAVNADHAAGIATVAVWEATATRTEDGYAAGVADAERARAQAAAIGDTTEAIDAAVDCDCTGASILGFFEGWHHVLGARADAYGGYSQVLYLYEHHVVGRENWQTYAWSEGRWLPASIAPLEQYLNGNAFDNDRAIAPIYGQWPVPKAAKPKPRLICIGKGARNTKACRTVRSDVARWTRGATTSQRVYRGRRCPAHNAELAKLNRRWAWFRGKLRRYPHVKHASRERALHATSAAIHRERRLLARAQCPKFGQRTRYFDARIAAAEKRYER